MLCEKLKNFIGCVALVTTIINVLNVDDGSAKIVTMSRRFGTVPFISGMFVMTHNEHSTDEGHSPETSGHCYDFGTSIINIQYVYLL